MRPFGSLIDKAVKLSKPAIPDRRLARVNPPVMSRLDEGITELFDHACITGELEAAADLLTVLEKWHARRSASYGRERRISGAGLERARKELERLCMLHGANPPAAKEATPMPSGEAPAAA